MTEDARRAEEAVPQEEANLPEVVASPTHHQQQEGPSETSRRKMSLRGADCSLADGYTHFTSNRNQSSKECKRSRKGRSESSLPDVTGMSNPSLDGYGFTSSLSTPTKTTENRISIGPRQFRDDNPQVGQHKPEKRAPFPEFGDWRTHHLQADGCMKMAFDSSLADGYRHMTKPDELLPEATNTNQSKDHRSLNSKNLKGCGCFPWG